MNPPHISLLLSVLLSCATVAARAATYYSDPAGTAQGDGSAKAPWPALSVLASSGGLAKLQGGDTLLLRNGNHGDVKFSGDNAKLVTITAEPGQLPKLSRLEIVQGSNWLVKGLTITPSSGSTPYKGNIVTLAEGGPGKEITLEDCFIYSVLDASAWTAAEWMNAYSGLLIGRNGSHITARNNYILNMRFSVAHTAPDCLFEGNVITNFSGDGLRITRDNTVVQYNTIKNAYVGPEQGDDNHDDLIQCFLFNKGTGTMRNETFRGNVLIGNEESTQPFHHEPQGLGFFDGPLVDFVAEQNVIWTNHYHGISFFDAVNCKIINNAVMAISNQKLKPWIQLSTKNKGGSHGNTVKNNLAHSFNLKADPGVVAENNVTVTPEAFKKRFDEQMKIINDKFGEFHPVAKFARLGTRKGEYKAPVPAVVPATAAAR